MGDMVSIIVPTYNRAGLIGRALRSILRQTYTDYEIIVVDDGSADGTKTAVMEIEDSRIRYVSLHENQGVSHARNVGIQEARYEYIAFLDSDDEWLPDKLDLQMRMMRDRNSHFGLVYCRMGGVVRDGSERYECPPLQMEKKTLEGELFDALLTRNVIGMPTVLVRKECLTAVGGFKETMHCLEDWEWILRIAARYRIGFVEERLVEVHKSAGSVSMNAGWHLVARCYMVSLYRQEIRRLGAYERMKEEILALAKKAGLYDVISELLTRDFEL